ncbi:RNA polymerase sigma factor [uncultured Maricaulis sp.]|uniref:RNA polymerase sigma factor n=1 Tax=uncultured Maricaulis sp. TaxID=174710 RepID=UPI0030D85D6C|tara:strand:+ start:23920 stop:24492 length:573 start_codon:yes stop_codon:yes gene_type:complete
MPRTESRDDAVPSDAELVIRARSGNEPAFGQLICRHQDSIFRFLSHQIHDRADASDVAQETFVALFRSLHRFDTGRPFLAWAFVIARNKARDHHRRRVALRWIGIDDQLDRMASPTPDPEREVADREALSQVELLIRALPEGLRTPLLLSAIEGLSHEEIGAVMSLSTKAVEVRIYRARKALKEQLSREG